MGQQDRFNREYYPAMMPGWDSRGAPTEDNQYSEQQVGERPGAPPPIQDVLRLHARIPVKFFFMAAILDDGTERTFCTPNVVPPERVLEFYDAARFKTVFAPTATSVSTPSFDEAAIPYRRPGFDMEPLEDFGVGRTTRNLKRRANFGGEEMPIRPTPRKKKSITISDTKQLWLLYEQRFKNCQQAACKLIAKAWIKTIEPKKQSTHPYTGKDEKAPDWWPQPWGEGQENRVRHKEPDHLYKRERLHLLCHILRMIVEPTQRQHTDIRKLQLNVTKLEEVTWEALSGWFADSNNPANHQKKTYLEEIFKVAKQEERFRDGMIDATVRVQVMSDDRIVDGCVSDTDENTPSRLDDGQERMPTSRSATPHKGSAQNMAPYHKIHGPVDEDGPLSEHYMSDMLRGPHYAQAITTSDFQGEVARYGEVSAMSATGPIHASGSMGLSDMHYITAQDPNRRPSAADAHSEFTTPTTSGGYDPWVMSSAPSNTPVYSMPGAGYQSTTIVPIGQQSLSMAHSQPYPVIYDGMSRGHDLGHTNMLRENLHHGTVLPFQEFGHHGGRVMTGPGVKQEGLNKAVLPHLS